MDLDTRRKINDLVEIIMEALEIKTPIKDISKVVEKLNGRVVRREVLPELADGRIYKCGHDTENEFVIEIPYYTNKNREKFTIAHEIGHLFLHMGYLIDDDMWELNENKVYLRKELGEMEYQAHEFAAALLMPRKAFFNIINESYIGNGIYDMERVACHFQVSIEAAINRGRWLGILAWG